jgi:hypothetical protein
MKLSAKPKVDISITLKNNKAQIIISVAIFVLCLGIAFSFFKGNSTITVNSAMSLNGAIPERHVSAFSAGSEYFPVDTNDTWKTYNESITNDDSYSTNDVIIINPKDI